MSIENKKVDEHKSRTPIKGIDIDITENTATSSREKRDVINKKLEEYFNRKQELDDISNELVEHIRTKNLSIAELPKVLEAINNKILLATRFN